MEAFKFAFETIVIGFLALPWLLIMLDLTRADPLTLRSIGGLVKAIPGDSGSTLLGVTMFTACYLLGSAISPVASEFLNDEDWIGHVLPTEQQTQTRAYFTRMSWPEREKWAESVGTAHCNALTLAAAESSNLIPSECGTRGLLRNFEMEESSLQLKGTDKTEHINRLRERLSILRGATFNAFVFLLLMIFALCSRWRARLQLYKEKLQEETTALPVSHLSRQLLSSGRRVSGWLALLPPLLIVVFALRYGFEDLINNDITDMPVMEAVLLFLGAFGLYLAARPLAPRVYVNLWSCSFALFFTVLIYGGYACTEVNYDSEVHRLYSADPLSAPVTGDRVPAPQLARSAGS